MSVLRDRAEDYLEARRALGYKLDSQARILRGFVAYADTVGATRITIELALTWATAPADTDPVWWSRRLSVVRCFARHLHAIDPDTEVPPAHQLPRSTARAVPYPYTPGDITALMTAAAALRSALQAATYPALIGLLSVTGMRVGEAIKLNRDDVDFDQGTVSIKLGKFGKSRLLPLHPTTLAALHAYAHRRDVLCPSPATTALFVSTVGTRLTYNSVRVIFAGLTRQAGLLPRSARCRPRLHDLRHRFAVQTLLDWYQADADVAARLPLLSTYLGHVRPGTTYWYFEATPELLALATNRIEHTSRAVP